MSYVLGPYDDALRQILDHGVRKQNRTGVDTIAIFGMQSRYKIDEYFPLISRRKVGSKATFAELLWFLSGSTLNTDLQSLGTNIWTPWVDKDFEAKHKYVKSALGPIYGFQLRHFGGEYADGDPANEKYGANGYDQLQYLVDRIKSNPDCRRILFSLWDARSLPMQRLAPCHYTFQVFIHEDKISGMLTQRSCDVPVGVPFNIAFYSAFLYMLGQQTGYKPYEFVHTMADAHVYVNQIEAVEKYLSSPIVSSPKLNLKKAKDIFSYSMEDFELVEYNPGSKIDIPVAV